MLRHGTASGYNWHKCRCEVCKDYKRASDRAYYERSRDRIKARTNAFHHANAGQINAGRRAKMASLSDEEKSVRREYNREYINRPGNRERIYANIARYSKSEKGREASRVNALNRRATLTDESRDYIEIIKHDPCVYCGSASKEIDHIRPVAAGGSGEWDNLAPACRSCNGRKHTLDLLPFLLRRVA